MRRQRSNSVEDAPNGKSGFSSLKQKQTLQRRGAKTQRCAEENHNILAFSSMLSLSDDMRTKEPRFSSLLRFRSAPLHRGVEGF